MLDDNYSQQTTTPEINPQNNTSFQQNKVKDKKIKEFKLYSPTFQNNGKIPVKYCDFGIKGGQNISIPIKWENVPHNTQSLFLVIVDPHPVARNWIHWIIKDIPIDTFEIVENASNTKTLPQKAIELKGTQGDNFYHGPQPPKGTGSHPYEIHLYALNTNDFTISDQPNWQEIQNTLSPITIKESVLIGYYP